MTINKTITIFLVDDNALYLKDLEITFASKPYYNIVTFATGELCLAQMALKPDIIILDYYLNSVKKDALNGLEILKKIRAVNSNVPVPIDISNLSKKERKMFVHKIQCGDTYTAFIDSILYNLLIFVISK